MSILQLSIAMSSEKYLWAWMAQRKAYNTVLKDAIAITMPQYFTRVLLYKLALSHRCLMSGISVVPRLD